MATAGIINGYPDGTFKGQKDITRFEMAQMIAKGMANQDRANAEQQAMLNRLSDEFSNELNNLGVRINHLEDRVGNVQITGDARRVKTELEIKILKTNLRVAHDLALKRRLIKIQL